MLKNENKFFLFSMMWLYSVLFCINFRLQKCNLFACTPRMNNSTLSKHTYRGLIFNGQRLFWFLQHNGFCRLLSWWSGCNAGGGFTGSQPLNWPELAGPGVCARAAGAAACTKSYCSVHDVVTMTTGRPYKRARTGAWRYSTSTLCRRNTTIIKSVQLMV